MINFVRTSQLNVETRDSGPTDGLTVLLLHGWPDDASTWEKIAAILNRAGLRTVAPMYRGFGGTSFLSAQAARTANTGMLALDAVELMDALDIDRFVVAGHDWGSNVAETLAVGWPQRVPRIAMLSTPSRLGGLQTPPFEQARRYWYHWFQATERGAQAVAADPKGFARIMWDTWSPAGWFDEKLFEKVARSFENPDWVAVTLHSYRSRWGEADVDPKSAELEAKVKATQHLSTPAIYFQGARDGVTHPEMNEKMAAKYSGPFERFILEDVGHFPTRESPDAVASRLIRHFC